MCRLRTGGGGENKNSKPSPARVTFGLAQIFFRKKIGKLHLKFYLGKRRQLDPSVAFSPNVFGGGGGARRCVQCAEFLHLDTFLSEKRKGGRVEGRKFFGSVFLPN